MYASDVLEYASTVGLTATLLVISKGWMVSRYQLKRKTKILQGLTTLLLCAIYAIIVVVEITARDPANTYNTYETTTARVLAVVRVLLLGWFVWCVQRRSSPTPHHQEDEPYPYPRPPPQPRAGASSAATTRRTGRACAASTYTSACSAHSGSARSPCTA